MKPLLCALARKAGGPLLALDSSTADASLALVCCDPDSVVERALPAASLPSESLVAGIADLLLAHHLKPADLKALVVGLGPGSFTGLRVGLATLKGIALGANVPMYGVSSMQTLAAGAPKGPVVVVHDARRGALYAGLYMADGAGNATCVLADSVTTLAGFSLAAAQALGLGAQGLAGVWVVGDKASEVAAAFGAQVHPAPLRIAYGMMVCARAIALGQSDDVSALCPTYLRTSSVGL